jgi:hypothetical protein
MALATNQLYSETTRGPLKRIQPADGPGSVQSRAFANVAGAPTLPVGTPCYVEASTGLLKKIVPGALAATNDIFCIVYPFDVKLDATGEVLGTVMFQGAVDFAELEALRAAGTLAGTAQELKDVARKPSNQERGIIIEGLDKIGGTTGLA